MYTIDFCLYRVVFFLYSDSEMLKAFEKTIEFFHDVYREASQLQPPPNRTYDVSRGKNRYVRLPSLSSAESYWIVGIM